MILEEWESIFGISDDITQVQNELPYIFHNHLDGFSPKAGTLSPIPGWSSDEAGYRVVEVWSIFQIKEKIEDAVVTILLGWNEPRTLETRSHLGNIHKRII